MAVWPASLPQNVEFGDYDERPPTTKLRTQMDAGPPKQRRRFTAGFRPIKARIMLSSKAQVETLDSFHENTLQGGALSFDWTHPRTGASKSLRFVTEPRYQPLGPEAWLVFLDLEVLP